MRKKTNIQQENLEVKDCRRHCFQKDTTYRQRVKKESSFQICSIMETKVSPNTRPLRTRASHFAVLTKAYAHRGPPHLHTLEEEGVV